MAIAFPLAQAQLQVGSSTAPAAPAAATPEPAPALSPTAAPTATSAVTTQPGTAPATQPHADSSFLATIMNFAPIILMVILVYFFLMRGQRKEEKTRKSMIAEMKRGDEVILISGKFGKVVDIRDDRVVIKVDEANNVKETYLKSAIQKVLNEDEKK